MNTASPGTAPHSDVLVIGGGLAGLTAAATAAKAGLSVRLAERSAQLGGRASTLEIEGYALNRGPHALYRHGAALRVWNRLGLEVKGKPAPARGAALRGGQLHRLPVGPLSLLSTSLLGWAEKGEAARILRGLPGLNTEGLAGVSLTEWLASLPAGAAVREVLGAFMRLSTYANAPDEFSALTAVRQLKAATGGVLYVDGGWQSLVRGLAGIAEASGAELLCSAPAIALSREPGGGHRVSLRDGRVLTADVVIVALGPHEAAALVKTAGARAPDALTSSTPVHMATLDVALRRLPGNGSRFVLGIDEPLYLSVHSDVAAVAPPGGAIIHTGRYLAPGDDPSQARAELEHLLDRSHPGWRSEVVHVQHLPHMKVAERLDLAREGGDAGRPDLRCPGLPGVLFAGDWVRGGEWLADAAVASGERAAALSADLLSARRAVA